MFVSIVIVLLIVLGMLATVLMLTHEEEDMPPPTGGPPGKRIINSTSVAIELGRINPIPRPTDLRITLERNGTHSGQYDFQSDDDGPLVHVNGDVVGTIHYGDLADNQRVNVGDVLKIRELRPGSNYKLILSWSSTGDVIMTTSFSTPP